MYKEIPPGHWAFVCKTVEAQQDELHQEWKTMRALPAKAQPGAFTATVVILKR